MANEISATVTLYVKKGGGVVNLGARTHRATMSGDDTVQATQVIGTTTEAISLGEISGAPRAFFIQNDDVTNFVTLGFTNPPTEMKLRPKSSASSDDGGVAYFESNTATIYAKADTAACRVVIGAAEA